MGRRKTTEERIRKTITLNTEWEGRSNKYWHREVGRGWEKLLREKMRERQVKR